MNFPEGFTAMKYVSNKVREGAATFLHTEYKFIAGFVVVVFVALFFIADWQTAISYLAGAIVSGTCGYCGMMIAVRANVRTTFACITKINEETGEEIPNDMPINRGLNVRRPTPFTANQRYLPPTSCAPAPANRSHGWRI